MKNLQFLILCGLCTSVIAIAVDVEWKTLKAKKISELKSTTGDHTSETYITFSGPQLTTLMQALPKVENPFNEPGDDGFFNGTWTMLEITDAGNPGVTPDRQKTISIECQSQRFNSETNSHEDIKDGPECRINIFKGAAG